MSSASTDHEKELNRLHVKFTELGVRGYRQIRPEKHVMEPTLWR